MSPKRSSLTAANLPPFVDLALGGSDGHRKLCKFPIADGSRLCRRRLNPQARAAAGDLHRALLSRGDKNSTLDDDLLRLLRLCTCDSHKHRDALAPQICEKWKRELDSRMDVVKQEPSRGNGVEAPDRAPKENSSGALGPLTRSQAPKKTEDSETLFRQLPATNISTGTLLTLDGMELVPYRHRSTVTDVLCRNLTATDLKYGTVYANTTQSLVKIGFTTVSAAVRRETIRSRCKRTLVTRYETMPMMHAFRIEKLVHEELQDMRFGEVSCRGCGIAHREWFHVDVKSAIEVIQAWEDWMNLARPYSGQVLSAKWRSTVMAMRKDKKPITGRSLLEEARCAPSLTTAVVVTSTRTVVEQDIAETVPPRDILDDDVSTLLDLAQDTEDPTPTGDLTHDELYLGNVFEDETTLLEVGPDTEDDHSHEDPTGEESTLLGPDAGPDADAAIHAATAPSSHKALPKQEPLTLSIMDATYLVTILSVLLCQVALLGAEIRQLFRQRQPTLQDSHLPGLAAGYSRAPLGIRVA